MNDARYLKTSDLLFIDDIDSNDEVSIEFSFQFLCKTLCTIRYAM